MVSEFTVDRVCSPTRLVPASILSPVRVFVCLSQKDGITNSKSGLVFLPKIVSDGRVSMKARFIHISET